MMFTNTKLSKLIMKMISSSQHHFILSLSGRPIPDISSWKIKFRNPDNYIVIIVDFYSRITHTEVTIECDKK